MDNYFGNENEYYDNPYMTQEKKRKPINIKYIIYILTIIILIIIGFSIAKILSSDDNTYSGIENKMIKEAKEYVTRNKISEKETYIDASKINVNIPSNCNILSGVL